MRDRCIACFYCAVWFPCADFLHRRNSLNRCRCRDGGGGGLMIHGVNDDDGDVCAWGQASSLSFAGS